MFNEAWGRQTIHHHNSSKLVQPDYEQLKKRAHVTPWKTVNEVLPIWAGPGGGVVRGDGGDGSHRQRPLGGGHGEGAHHGGRTRPPPFVGRRLTQHAARETERIQFECDCHSFLYSCLWYSEERKLLYWLGKTRRWSINIGMEINIGLRTCSWSGIGRTIWWITVIKLNKACKSHSLCPDII